MSTSKIVLERIWRFRRAGLSSFHTNLIFTILLSCLIRIPGNAQITFVDLNAFGANDGSSWANAYTDLNVALTNTSSGQIWVAQGVYKPSNCNPCNTADRENSFFSMKSGVALYGGFNGTESILEQRDFINQQTILSGDTGTPGDSTDNTYRVLIAEFVDQTSILDGFIIEEGNADGSFGFASGGGLWINANPGGDSSPTISNCIFRNNYAGGGGAVRIDCVLGGTSSATFTNCSFFGNTASLGVVSSGAAMQFLGNSGAQITPTITGCLFENNFVGNDGGAISSTPSGAGTVVALQISDCQFIGNRATDRGGAIWMRIIADAINQSVISNCTFESNLSGGQGGAVYERASFGAVSNVQYNNCVFQNNSTDGTSSFNPGHAGAMYLRGSQNGGTLNSVVNGCTFSGNTANEGGGAIALYGWMDGTCQPTFQNSVIDQNTATEIGGGILFLVEDNGLLAPTFTNTTVSNNLAEEGGGMHFLGDFGQEGQMSLTIDGCNFVGNSCPNIVPGNDFFSSGAGIHFELGSGSSVTATLNIDNSVFDANSAHGAGGAIATMVFTGGSFSPQISNCTFTNNLASQSIVSSGGALSFFGNQGSQILPVITNCLFQGNQCVNNDGGAISGTPSGIGTVFNPIIQDCDFIENISADRGAAIWFRMVSEGTLGGQIENCLFEQNSAGGNGGAIYHRVSFDAIASTEILNCTFKNNTSGIPNFPTNEDGGGAIVIRGSQNATNQILVANCLFEQNTSAMSGGAIIVTGAFNGGSFGICTPTIVNNTFFGNVATNSANAIAMEFCEPIIANNIIWNGTDGIDGQGHNPMLSNNIIQGGYSGPGNSVNLIADDPLFVNPGQSNYRLGACSPAINVGDNVLLPLQASNTDLDGATRIVTSIVDLGAYENDGSEPAMSISIDSSNISCFGFCDGLATVNVSNGAPGYTFAWSNGNDEASASDLCPGSYAVTVSDQENCIRVDSVQIIEPDELLLTVSNDTSVCSGQVVSLQATANGGTGNLMYQWNEGLPDGPMQSVSPTVTTTYTVTVTDQMNCMRIADVVVTIEAGQGVEISGDTSICPGEMTTLDAGSFASYIWSNGETSGQVVVSDGDTYIVTVTDENGCVSSDQIQVIEQSSPAPTIEGDAGYCLGESTTLSTQEYVMYQWSTTEVTESINVGIAGSYMLVVTDENGCTGQTSIDVIEHPNPQPTISGDLQVCPGEFSDLDAGIFQSYQWSNGEVSQMIQVPAGNYSVVVTDENSCTGNTSVEVTEFVPPDPDILGDPEFCPGESSELNAGNFASYEWSTGELTQVITASLAGIYVVTVTDDNGCTGTDQIDIIELAPPSVDIAGDEQLCSGESTFLSAGIFSTYLWSTTETSSEIEVSDAGIYQLTVTDENGCTGTDEFQVDIISILPEITGQESICFGQNSILEVGDFESYQWSTTETTPTITVESGGIYSVTVTDLNGCTGTDDVEITQTNELMPEISGDNLICAGSEAFLDAGIFDFYEWSTGESTQSIFVSTPDTYTVTVTDLSGCSGSQSVVLDVVEAPQPAITGDVSGCSDDLNELAVGSFSEYLWSTGDETSSIVVFTSGTYIVTVTDENGCTGEDEVSVEIFLSPEPEILGQTAFCTGGFTTINVDQYTSYLWSTGENTQFIDVSMENLYQVTVTDENGCTATDEVIIEESEGVIAEINGTTSFCNGGSTQLMTNEADQILWSTGEQTSTITVTNPGMYAVTLTSSGGCVDSAQVEVTESESLTPTIIGAEDFCEGDTVVLQVGQFATYQWSTGAESQNLSVFESGVYTLTVTDASGCNGSSSVVINVNDNPEPQIFGELNFCAGESSQLNVDEFVSFLWSTNETSQSIEVFVEDVYTVTVTDENGCMGSDQVIVEELDGVVAEISGSTSFCIGGSTQLSVEDVGQVEWSTGEMSSNISVSLPGIYSVTITSVSGCIDSAQVEVTQSESLTPVIIGENQICQGDTTILSVGEFDSYEWSTGQDTDMLTVFETGVYALTVTDISGCSGSSTIQVVVNDLPVPIIEGPEMYCPGDTIELILNEVFPTVQWSNGSQTTVATVSSAGSLSVVVIDEFGCEGSTTIDVSEFDPPVVEITGSTSFCTGSETTIFAGVFDDYIWSNGASSNQIVVNTPGVYLVTVTDENGCTASSSVEVNESDMLSPVVSGEPVFCAGGSTVLFADGFDSYLWSTGEMTSSISVAVPGTITLMVTDENGCMGSTSIEVMETEPFQPMITGSSTFCTGSSTSVSVSEFQSYLWSTGDSTQTIVVDQAGLISVIVTDINGCTGASSIQVDEEDSLSPIISGDSTFCTGEGTMLSVGEFTEIIWSTGDTTAQIEVSSSGIVSVIVTDANGCTGDAVLEVIENDLPIPEIIGQLSICQGGQTELSVNGFTSVQWSNGASVSTVEINSPGTISVLVTDENGCTGSSSVEVIETDELFPMIEGDDLICAGQTTSLSVVGFNEVLWSTGSMESMITIQDAGIYTVNVSDAGGCTGETSIQVDVVDSPEVDAGENIILNQELAVQLNATGAISYQWSPAEGLSCTNCSNPMALPLETTTYVVTGTNDFGCSSQDSLTIFLMIDLDLDPVNTITPNGDQINDQFVVRGLDGFPNARLRIVNRWGDVVYATTSYQNDWAGTYNGQDLPAGTYLYFLKVRVFDQVAEHRGTVTIIRE